MLLRTVPLLLLALACSPAAENGVLARMDREAAGFHDMTANVTNTSYTAVLQDTTKETGTIRIMRTPSGPKMRVDFSAPNKRSIYVDKGRALYYLPNTNEVQEYNLGKEGKLVDTMLLVGWGTPLKELQKNYQVKVGGDEDVAGQKATRVDLTPKDPKALERVKLVQLWIPQNAGHPVQQKVLQPGGDYYLATYSDIRLNTNLSAAALNLNLPKDVKVVRPQQP